MMLKIVSSFYNDYESWGDAERVKALIHVLIFSKKSDRSQVPAAYLCQNLDLKSRQKY